MHWVLFRARMQTRRSASDPGGFEAVVCEVSVGVFFKEMGLSIRLLSKRTTLGGDRTRGHTIKSRALCLLSYEGTFVLESL